MPKIIQLRRDPKDVWQSVNPLLAEGEFAIETDTKKFKLGDGIHRWADLSYAGPRGIFPIAAAVEIAWDEDYPSNYSELTFDGSQLSQIEIWDTSAKGTHIFTKTLNYTAGKLSSVVVQSHITGASITKSITYEGAKIKSVTRTYSPPP